MKFTILTLFPEFIEQGLHTSILGKACDKGLLSFKTVNIRDYADNKNNRVDDYTYGGGAGMLIQAQPVFDAVKNNTNGKVRTIYVTPQGKPFSQSVANELAREDELVFICGHYEGIDERALDLVVTDKYSIGDYVLTGGELPSLVMIDAISRLVPGVLGNDASAEIESFYGNLLEYPQYTRPEVWNGISVPSVLLEGNPKEVSAWRKERSIETTKKVRPDLLEKYNLREFVLSELIKDKRNNIHIYEALRRGYGEILNLEPLTVYLPNCGIVYFADISSMKKRLATYEASELYEMLPESADTIIIDDDIANIITKPIDGRAYFNDPCRVYNAVYTQNVHKKIKNKNIKVLSVSDHDYIDAHYGHGDSKYNFDRLSRGLVYGIYSPKDASRLVGFIGIHCEGSIGMLYIEEDFRGRGYGLDLENFMINHELECGNIPYGQVIVGNEASFELQKKNGLYIGDKVLTWLNVCK